MGTNELHHYIPKVYLKNFLASMKNRLAVYEKKSNRLSEKPIIHICSEPNFFDLDGAGDFLASEEGQLYIERNGINPTRRALEDELSSFEATLGGWILPPIIKQRYLCCIPFTDFKFLLNWMAWLYLANPSTKNFLKQRDSLHTNTSLCGGLMHWHDKVFPFFHSKKWELAYSYIPLISCDRPVILTAMQTTILDYQALNGGAIIFPLSPSLVLIGKPHKERRLYMSKATRILPEAESHLINDFICVNAYNVVFASSKISLEKYTAEGFLEKEKQVIRFLDLIQQISRVS